MDEITDKEIDQINILADKLLAVVMNAEMESPEIAITALGHVAAMISLELKMPEPAFLFCMGHSYQTVIQLDKDTEVH
jgi:hypothetical protein